MRIPFYSLVLSPLLLLAGCGGSGSEGVCVAGEVTRDIAVQKLSSGFGPELAPWSVVDVLDRAEGASVLLERSGEDGAKVLAFLGPYGPLTEVATVADVDGHRLDAAPVAMAGGKRCVVYLVANKTLQLACDDGSIEDSKLEVDSSSYGPALLPVGSEDGSLIVLTTTYASFTIVARDPSGYWSEIEQHESSISWPEDVALHDGSLATCFISASGHAVITAPGGTITSAGEANSCKIALDDSSVHVLLDTGFATIPRSSLGGEPEGTFDVKASSAMPVPFKDYVLTLVVVGGKPTVVQVNREDHKLQRVALDSGTVTDLADTKDSDDSSYRAKVGEAAGSLTVASSHRFDSSSDPAVQPLQIDTYCTAAW